MVREQADSGKQALKFLCSYGGKILPRKLDGKLRYVGGYTRILSVDPSVSYAELMVKLMEFCGFSVSLRCTLPGGDLETLISIKSDEDLANLIEEYDRASSSCQKIRAVLSPPTSLKVVSPPSSSASSVDSSPHNSPSNRTIRAIRDDRCRVRSRSPPVYFRTNLCQYPCCYVEPRVWCGGPCCGRSQ